MGQRSSLKGNGRHRTVRELRRVFRIWLMETEQEIIKHRGTDTRTRSGGGVARWVVRGPQCSRPRSQVRPQKRSPNGPVGPNGTAGRQGIDFLSVKKPSCFCFALLFVSRRRWECAGSCDVLCNGVSPISHDLDRQTECNL